MAPQSNQRGIETTSNWLVSVDLNAPQSNQRGIETIAGLADIGKTVAASIEPAWD